MMIQEQERHVAGHRYDRDTGKQVKALQLPPSFSLYLYLLLRISLSRPLTAEALTK